MSSAAIAASPAVAPKAPKVKKTPAKPKVPAAHPPYAEMIKAAVTTLKERTGTSRQAILKYVCSNYKVDADKVQSRLRVTLKKMIDSKVLVNGAAAGRKGSGCFKLAKPVKEAAAKKPKAKKPAAGSTKSKAKKTKVVKKAAKPKSKAASTKSKAKPKAAPKKKPVVKKTAKKVAAKPKKA